MRAQRILYLAGAVLAVTTFGCLSERADGVVDGVAVDAATTADPSSPVEVVALPDVPSEVPSDLFVPLPDASVPPDVPPDVPLDLLQDPGQDAPDTPDLPDTQESCQVSAPGGLCDTSGGALCPAGLLCMQQPDGPELCQQLEDGNCAPCCDASDCAVAGSACLVDVSGDKHCAAPCTDACAQGFYCDAGYCRPDLGTCACTSALLGSSLPCSNSNPIGTCTGQTVCLLSGWSTCSAQPATPEVSNALDDDCDGSTDEDLWCGCEDVDGDGFAPDPGDDCNDFDSGIFPGAPEPCCLPTGSVEECDKDCDGVVTPCSPGDADGDGFTPSQGDCDDLDPNTYPGAVEKCGDGVDQDCFGGDVDCFGLEDLDGDGFHVSVDCNDYDPAIHPYADELCNFVDDDCDGLIDEGNPTSNPNPCGPGPPCPPGEWVCVHDPWAYLVAEMCINVASTAPELCNGVDDDCDGATDEDFFGVGLACDGPDSDGCKHGVYECSADGEGLVCGPEAVEDLVEVCDELDNDCDGSIDNWLTYGDPPLGKGDPCDGVGECGLGIAVCDASQQLVCSTDPTGPFPDSVPETCNQLDDDCDGETDEPDASGTPVCPP